MGKLKVKVINALNLIGKDRGGTSSDPYFWISVGDEGFKSKTIKNTLKPVWDETFTFNVKNPQSDSLVVCVFDWDRFSKDDSLGILHLPLSNLPKGKEVTQMYKLRGVKKGEIQLAITAEDFGVTTAVTTIAAVPTGREKLKPPTKPRGAKPPPGYKDDEVKELRALFEEFDVNKSGYLTKPELKMLLGMTVAKQMSDGILTRFVDGQFSSIDADKSGMIDFNEFLTLHSKLKK
eukprot:TRINITY_DN329_c0_g1_i1.p1 TRINITY_DN329_c0_g1~~TRINITY_DN329_c0_g1_i1.p1  ORF type:complete len:234 (-),score=53.90 TRINITY_DN329_c0_g1_i1:83-784(-)